MTTLKWDHAVQFVNQPDEAIATFAGQGLNAFAGGRPPWLGNLECAQLFRAYLHRVSRHLRLCWAGFGAGRFFALR